MRKRVEQKEAQDILSALPLALKTEYVPLSEALDRELTENAVVELLMPPYDKSAFDGFAFRTCDVMGTLRIMGEIAADGVPTSALHPNTAVRVLIGSSVPKDADVVFKQEDVHAENGCVIDAVRIE